MFFSFSKATNRNTQVYWLMIYGVRVLLSYSTPVAFTGGGDHARRDNDWGPTTRRHMRECNVDGWPIVQEEKEFERRMNTAIMNSIIRDREMLTRLVEAAATRKLTQEDLDVVG
jgi:hypothetical protein